MTRVIEIFGKMCEFDELPDVLKTLDAERTSELLGTCAILITDYMHCNAPLAGVIEQIGLSDEFIIATIKVLLNDTRDYWDSALKYTLHTSTDIPSWAKNVTLLMNQ